MADMGRFWKGLGMVMMVGEGGERVVIVGNGGKKVEIASTVFFRTDR